MIPETGWYVTSRTVPYTVNKGEHGYDNNAETMRVSIVIYVNPAMASLYRVLWLLEDLPLEKTISPVVLIIFNCTILNVVGCY